MANNVDIVSSQEHARTADTEAKRLFARRFRTDHPEGGQAKSFYDFELPDDELVETVADVLASQPDLQNAFTPNTRNQKDNSAYYVAAHLVMHDTDPALLPCQPLNSEAFGDNGRSRVVNLP